MLEISHVVQLHKLPSYKTRIKVNRMQFRGNYCLCGGHFGRVGGIASDRIGRWRGAPRGAFLWGPTIKYFFG